MSNLKFKYRRNMMLLSFLVMLFILAFIIHKVQQNYRKKSLRNYNKTWAIYLDDVKGIGQTGSHYIYFDKRGKKHQFRDKHIRWLEIGDTVHIKYSQTDNSITEVIGISKCASPNATSMPRW